MNEREPRRYAFRHAFGPASGGRTTSLIILAVALAAVLLTHSIAGIVLSLALAAVAIGFMLRPPNPHVYVELRDTDLVIHAILATRIELKDILSAELHRQSYPPPLTALMNAVIVIDRIFGGRFETIGPDAPPDVMLRFRRWVTTRMVLPPFILPRRNWLLIMEDSRALKSDLDALLEKNNPGSEKSFQ